ncbi:MAG: hypothetical protein RLZZ76_136 [Candidatus Parcubacteria bacterium]|jgi:hypothetical protein
MIRFTDQYIWNIFFILFYLCLLGMAVIILQSEARVAFSALQLQDFVLMALASYRLTQLFLYDSMTKFFREQFYDVKVVRTKITLVKPGGGPRRTLADLLSCPWCFGVWATSTVVFFYLLTPLAYVPVLILALSSVVSTLQITANMIGHKAEQLKRDTETPL